MALLRPSGNVSLRTVPVLERPTIESFEDAIEYGVPNRHGLSLFAGRRARRRTAWQVANMRNFRRSLIDQVKSDAGALPNRLGAIGHLWLAKVGIDGEIQDYGLASCRVVTDAGVQFIVDAFQNLTELENMKYHAVGTSTSAEAAAQTALGTELTTQYSTSNTRPTGTLGEKSGDAKTYETTATVTVSSGVAITEHGIFSAATSGTGVLLDRSQFAAVNLATGESLQATYQLTFPSGS
jgi:hypothetical protein